MNRSHRHHRSRGFATTFALFLVVLVTAALLALTSFSVADARRTTNEALDAQVRQLVCAAAQEEARTEPRALELPAELIRQQAEIQAIPDAAGSTTGMIVRVKLMGRVSTHSISPRAASPR